MKKNILIIALLIVAQIGAFTLKAHSQYSNKLSNVITVKDDTAYNQPTTDLIADETTISYTKTMAKIECCNEKIADILTKKFEQIITRLTWAKKKDRNGTYKQYNIYLNKDDAAIIVKWAKTNL
jgi:lipopolysaccharide export system protein LptA